METVLNLSYKPVYNLFFKTFYKEIAHFFTDFSFLITKMRCSLKTTTSSGTFTIVNTRLSRCEAKKYCKERNQILAPITNDVDKTAILDLIDPRCAIHRGDKHYHIGLEVTACGDTQERTFSNGVAYDKAVHGHLYDDLDLLERYKKCPMAYMWYYTPKKLIIGREEGCGIAKYRFICLDQSTATSSPISQEKSDLFQFSSSQALVAVGVVFAVVGCFAVTTTKMYRRNKFLEEKVEALEDLKDLNK